ncbi:MAG: hypothetical protein J6V70_07375 [Kiritimatiellae bacterium]|nr:hypothetical protein [Kiritimatiellia bacterium]
MADIATWGISDSVNYGIIQSRDYTESHKTGECRNEKGQLVRLEQYDQEYQGVFTIITTGDLPDIGDSITIEEKTMYVSAIEETENNTSFKKAKITCKGTKKITSVEDVSE